MRILWNTGGSKHIAVWLKLPSNISRDVESARSGRVAILFRMGEKQTKRDSVTLSSKKDFCLLAEEVKLTCHLERAQGLKYSHFRLSRTQPRRHFTVFLRKNNGWHSSRSVYFSSTLETPPPLTPRVP